MSQTWKNKSCEKCIYRVNMDCRLNPPSISGWCLDLFPVISNLSGSYKNACSHYSEVDYAE